MTGCRSDLRAGCPRGENPRIHVLKFQPLTADPMPAAPTDKVLLNSAECAKYLGVSRSYFDDEIRVLIPVVDMRSPRRKQPMWRWAKADLDAFIESRRRAKSAA